MISKLYTIISNKLWDLSLYFGDLYNRWVLTSQEKALGPCRWARFRTMQTYKNYSFLYLLTFVSVKDSFSRKKHFLKNWYFFFLQFFFQGHNWVTNYPDSEFHDHWKTVTLSSISPNFRKPWRFLAFWLSLCFDSFLLFLVCHDTTFLFSTRAMTALVWLTSECSPRYDSFVWENRRDSRHVTSRHERPQGFVYCSRYKGFVNNFSISSKEDEQERF